MTAADLLLALATFHGSLLVAIDEEELMDPSTPPELRGLADELTCAADATDDAGWAHVAEVYGLDLYGWWEAGLLASEPEREGLFVRVVLR